MKIEVNEHAVIKRMNRKLREFDWAVRKSRGRALIDHVGEYCIWSMSSNLPATLNIDLESYARSEGVLRANEVVVQGR